MPSMKRCFLAGLCAAGLAVGAGGWGAAALRAGDLAGLRLFKAGWYVQTGDAEPELLPQAQQPFDFTATAALSPELLADPDALMFLAGLSLRTPGGRTEAMELDPLAGLFVWYEGAVSAQALNLRYGAGTYRFTLHSLISGDTSFTVPLAPDDYPPAPRLLNFTAAQAVDPAREFTLEWNAFTGEGERLIGLELARAETFEVVWAAHPLPGDATTHRIPAGVLAPETRYRLNLWFTRYTHAAPTADPPAFAGFESFTEVPLRTVQPGGSPQVRFTTWRRLPDGGLELTLEGPPGARLTLQGAEGVTGPWTALETRPAAGITATFVVPAGQLGARRFFRARIE